MIVFKWTFPDGVDTATFARDGTASFVQFEAAALDPTFVRATDLSRPFVLARDAEGGTTL